MNKIGVEILADSKNEHGNRITTFVCTFPRIILAEVNTHRTFSRNSVSSRAIPFKKMVQMVEEDPFIPIAWQKDHKGMQGTEYIIDEKDVSFMEYNWRLARIQSIKNAELMNGRGCTKQLCNRLLEPFMWHTAIITATEWENFFELRCPQYEVWAGGKEGGIEVFRSKNDAIETIDKNKLNNAEFPLKEYSQLDWLSLNKGQGEIHIMALAEAMWDALKRNTPKQLKAGDWHIPFGHGIETRRVFEEILGANIDHSNSAQHFKDAQEAKVKIATARCARVSYLNFEGKDDYKTDIKLHDMLLSSGHMSPFEHCARAMSEFEYTDGYVLTQPQKKHMNFFREDIQGVCGNFKGFVQYRKIIENA